MYACGVYVQVQSTRLVTPHSLWPTKVDTGKWSSILLKNISVTQNVCILQTVKLFVVYNLLVSTVAVNEAGDTPLSLECSRGDLEMVKALINMRVDPNSKFYQSVTLLMVVFYRTSQQGW